MLKDTTHWPGGEWNLFLRFESVTLTTRPHDIQHANDCITMPMALKCEILDNYVLCCTPSTTTITKAAITSCNSDGSGGYY